MPKRGKAAEFLDLFLELREFVVVQYLAPLMVSTVRLLWSRNAVGRQKFRTILDHCRQAGPGHGLHRSLSFGDSLASEKMNSSTSAMWFQTRLSAFWTV